MSEQYNLILGLDLTCQASVRRKYYRWMVGYLVFTGLILTEGAAQISHRMREVRDASNFVASVSDMMPSMVLEKLIRFGNRQEETLVELESVANLSLPFLPVLFEAVTSLPEGLILRSMDMDPDQVTMVFRFIDGGEATPESYLSLWRKNKELNIYLGTLRVIERSSGGDEDKAKWIEIHCVAVIK